MKPVLFYLLTSLLFSLTAYAAITVSVPPKYFGIFGSAKSEVGTGNYITAVSKISNFVHIRETDQTVLLQKMLQAQQANLFILMDVQLYARPWQSEELHADWKLRISKLLELLAPYKANIFGFLCV